MEPVMPDPSTPPSPPKMSTEPIHVQPHGAETPLKILLTVVGIVFWILIVVSLVGAIYALIIGLFFLLAQITLIVHLRGNSVKLGPKQMPGLYKRVVTLSKRMGLKKVPDAYLVQSGGVLNAFATKFGSRTFIALYSEMVRACADNSDALDFIIGHELGHLHRGHLRWRILKAPAMIIPFLGTAYYRSCEYTCDEYGKQSCTDHSKCLDGLCLLASGARYASVINRQEFVAQTKDLNTVLMTLGSWFSTHPPLAKRAARLSPELVPQGQNESLSMAGALFIAAILCAVPVVAIGIMVPGVIQAIHTGMAISSAMHPKPMMLDPTHIAPSSQFKHMPPLPPPPSNDPPFNR